MVKNIVQYSLSLSSVFFVFFGCSENNDVTPQDEAIFLMDRGSYSQAIVVLDSELLKSPHNQKIRVLLAASYAGRAGLFMEDYIYLAENILEPLNSEKILNENKNTKGLQRLRERSTQFEKKNALEFIESVYSMITDLNNLILSIEAIPTPESAAGKEDLQKAILILEKSQSLTGGAALYRGLLRLSKLKIDFENEFNFDHLFKCKPNLTEQKDRFIKLRNQLDQVFDDLILGIQASNPKSELSNLQIKIVKDINQIINLIESLGDEQAQMALLHIQRNVLGICL